MIARLWHGVVPVSKKDEYLGLMRKMALPGYLATRGNRGASCLYRTEAELTHFEMLTFWDDTDAIKRFAGEDYSLAKYYDFDSGNRGIHLLRRPEAARVHFLLLSFWESRQAIVAYAGADIAKANYYAYDLECLIDPAPNVEHYEVLSGLALATD